MLADVLLDGAMVALSCALLVGMLLLRRRAAQRAEPPCYECNGFDAQRVTVRIQAVRKDYLSEAGERRLNHEFQMSLLAAARASVSKIAFFNRPAQEFEQEETEGTEEGT